MPAPETEKSPNAWSVNEEFLKTVVALASALLGLTVTFAGQLTGKLSNSSQWILILAWILCCISIAMGVAAHGFIVCYLKTGEQQKASALCSNVSTWVLFAAAVAFLFVGYYSINSPKELEYSKIIEKVYDEMPVLTKDKQSQWQLKSYNFDDTKNLHNIVISKVGANDVWTFKLDKEGKMIETIPK